MSRSSLCGYSNAYLLDKVTITTTSTAIGGQPNNAANKEVIFKNCAPFTNCISRISNTQVGDALDINVVMSIWFNLIE